MSEERRQELRRFLRDRRARVTPTEVGLPSSGRRRVSGLRREEVASLAGIGISWYTALENGDAQGVSPATLRAVAEALRLSESERDYLLGLAAASEPSETAEAPTELILATMESVTFPAYVITTTWDVVACNDTFLFVWSIDSDELPFNAIERLFIDTAARALHGTHFAANIAPVIAMFRSAVGRRPSSQKLQALRDRLTADPIVREIWDAYDIQSPLLPNKATIGSRIGAFTYEAVTLVVPDARHALVVQVPDAESRRRLGVEKGRVRERMLPDF